MYRPKEIFGFHASPILCWSSFGIHCSNIMFQTFEFLDWITWVSPALNFKHFQWHINISTKYHAKHCIYEFITSCLLKRIWNLLPHRAVFLQTLGIISGQLIGTENQTTDLQALYFALGPYANRSSSCQQAACTVYSNRTGTPFPPLQFLKFKVSENTISPRHRDPIAVWYKSPGHLISDRHRNS